MIGAGAAGTAAALSAHEAGASVVVLDKGDETTAGGNTRISAGGWFTHSNPSRAADFLRELSGPYPINESVARTWAEETARTSDWLRKLDIPVAQSPDYHTAAEYAELDGADCYEGMDTVDGQTGNEALYRALAAALSKRGIEVRHGAEGRRLIRAADGPVTGVILADGTRMRARGGVVLTTGGFSGDPQMVRDHLRLPRHVLWGSPLSTGDGHRMARDVGADMWHMGNMMTITGIDIGHQTGMYVGLWTTPHYLFVSAEGRRFMDEAEAGRHGHIQRDGRYELFPTDPFHVVFDATLFNAGPLSPSPDILPVGWEVLKRGTTWSADNTAEVADGTIVRADSVDELAARTGIDAGALGTSVRQYNAACHAGHDEWFGRSPEQLGPVNTPPYFAMEVVPMLGWSNGGPRRDDKSRVLDAFGGPIEGLYAAGEVSSTYSWCKDGGFHIADALAFGRVAGGTPPVCENFPGFSRRAG